MTEILEWAALRSNNDSNDSGSKNGFGLSTLGGIFGLGSSSNSQNANEQENDQSKALGNVITEISEDRKLRVRAALCPQKLRFAMNLVELGLLKNASSYILEIKEIIQQVGVAGAPPPVKNNNSNSGSGKKIPQTPGEGKDRSVQPFSRKFIRAFHEFVDRLNLHDSTLNVSDKQSQSISSGGNNSSSGNIWGLGSVFKAISTANLKEFVDGPAPEPSPSHMDKAPTFVPPNPQNSFMANSSNAPQAFGSNNYNSNNNFVHKDPYSSSSIPNNFNEIPINDFGGNSSMNNNMYNNNQHEIDNSMNYNYNSFDNKFPPANKADNFFANQSQANPNLQHQSHNNQPLHQNTNQHISQPPQTNNNINNNSVPPQNNNSADANKQPVNAGEEGSGLVGKVRKGLLSWFYPDAHDANDNLGKQLEAYYDSKTGQWVFPGEVIVIIKKNYISIFLI